MKTLSHLAISIITLLIIVPSSQAALVLDQSQQTGLYGFSYDMQSGVPDVSRWQTFIPTMSTLERVELLLEARHYSDGNGGFIYPYGNNVLVNIDIQDSLGTSLWSGSEIFVMATNSSTEWKGFDVPSIALTPGDTYKIEINGYGVWMGDVNSVYPGTNDAENLALGYWVGYDYAFKTYSVPEPISLALMAIGAVTLRIKR